MTRIAKTTTIALAALLITVATLVGTLLSRPAAPAAPAASTTASVSSFNDGYATAMQDACQQHSAYACQWLKQN